jgi:hypothetical protein
MSGNIIPPLVMTSLAAGSIIIFLSIGFNFISKTGIKKNPDSFCYRVKDKRSFVTHLKLLFLKSAFSLV